MCLLVSQVVAAPSPHRTRYRHHHGFRPPPPPAGPNFNDLLPLKGAAVAGGLVGFGLATFLNGNGK